MRVKIVTDSTCDLPRKVAEELGITVIPVNVHFGDEVYKDGVELSTDEFYRKLQTNSVLPKTSVPSPGIFREVYQMLASKSDAIVSIHVAAAMSATCEAARLGAAELKHPISIVDSQTASMACGLLAVIAARAAREGASLADIEVLLKDAIPRTITYGVFSTMEYLYKGGRIGRAQAFLGNILKISPVLAIRRGEILPIARVRTRPKAINRLCGIIEGLGTLKEMSVMQTTNPDEAEALAQRLASVFPQERMIKATLGPAMGTYVGPDAVGVALIAEKPI
ncbi:MAG TPA: DegV family protein [Dehalococcoidia bacterium]|nr:DegV family protein [Dehalococcoidia bacterium]